MDDTQTRQSFADYLTVGEAASYLGVSPWTLRNWDKSGKLKTLRHPKNGYRMYRHEELEAILEPDGSWRGVNNRFAPPGDVTEVGDAEHFVQFYETDAFLVDSVSRFVGDALSAGDRAMVISTPSHRHAIQRKLRRAGFDISAARDEGRYHSLDAARLLAKFLVNDLPDPSLFSDVVGGMIISSARRHGRLRVFGEMVEILLGQGKREAAIRLEELWNDLAKTCNFSLFCAYPLDAFGGALHDRLFGDICDRHSRVIPAESYSQISSESERLRVITRLQQKAESLEAEVAHRQGVENRLQQEIAERKRAEESLRASDRRKDEFLAVLAHELRNSLAPVRNAIQIMRIAAHNPVDIEQARSIMERQIQQMVRLVDDLLDVSRITRGKVELRKERITLASAVASAVETSRPLIDAARHDLTVSLPPQTIELVADQTRLAQVISNLLNNAAKYTDPGGKIWLNAVCQNEHVVLSVRDTGIGISPEMLPRVFDMFAQVDRSMDRSQGGLGVGLTLVQTLVELHGGTVGARSGGLGQGSEFTVRIPVAPKPRSNPQEDDGLLGASNEIPMRRILVVDDNPDVAESLAMLLRMFGQDVRTANHPQAAIDSVQAFRPEIAFLDIGLPEMSGYDLARLIRQQPGCATILLVAVTGWGQEEDRRRAQEAGFNHHVTKPPDVATLERLLHSGTAGTP